MDKENTFTTEQLMDMVKNITSNAKIGQFIVENHGTVNYHEKSGEAPDDRHMRQVLQELMEAKDENGNKLMVEQQQWFAVYRFCVEYCKYPANIAEFERTITKMHLENLNPPCKASSISKASQSLTALACKVSQWGQYAVSNESYAKQYRIAKWLIEETM
jgi:hypothetical protein